VGSAVRRDADVRAAAERAGLDISPPPAGEARAEVASRDYVETQMQRRAGAESGGAGLSQGRSATATAIGAGTGTGGDSGGEGALHKFARGTVKALKVTGLRPPVSDVAG
jgi:hypothetical protein